MLSRREFVAGGVASAAAQTSAAPAAKPNVVMFMTDDHGAWAMGSYGCGEIRTPTLDRLAAQGARFTNAFACTPVCSPSRMTYLTGKLPSQHGVQDYLIPEDSAGSSAIRFLDGHTTYAEILASRGYSLGMCGKWHMGEDEHAQRGFSYWHTVPGGGGTYRDPVFVTNGERRKLTGYKTDLVTDGALAFLDTVRDRPFYLLVPYFAPHTPYDFQPEEDRRPYRDCAFSCFPRTPPHAWQNKGLARHHANRESMLAYSALITGVDRNAGRILAKLDELRLRDNTLIVFTADQGWNAGHHGVWGKGNGTIPFNMYEESLRVPMIWNHPGRIRAGQVIPSTVSSYDYMPTLLDYLGLPAHKDSRLLGQSYAPLLGGGLRGGGERRQRRLYFEYAYVRGLRTGNLKYIERTGQWPSELYDLEADPGETRNVIAEPGYRKTVASLRGELSDTFRKAGAPPLDQWRSTTRQHLFEYR